MTRHDVTIDICVARYQDGLNLKQIARLLKCSNTLVRDRLEEAGVYKKGKTPQPARHGTRTMYAHGCRCEACRQAEHEQYLKRPEAQKRRRYKRLKRELIDAIEADYLKGATTYELGEKYGVDHQTVSAWMIERGHRRGKSYGATAGAIAANRKRREEANKRIIAELGTAAETPYDRREARKFLKEHDEGITWKAVAKRNGSMKCEICGGECDPNDRRWGCSGPLYPSVDHITRLVDGGTHTWDNVRLAHCNCNIRASANMNKKAG